MKHLDRFRKITEDDYRWLLRVPTGTVRCVIDTDARNEIDDQFALVWALLSQDQLKIEGIYAAPYSYRNRLSELRMAHKIRLGAKTARAKDLTFLQRYTHQLDRLDAQGMDIFDDRQVDPQGMTMVTPDEGMEKSYQEILTVCDKMGINFADKVFRGANRYLESYDTPVQSEAVEHLIDMAKSASTDQPLYIVAIGAPTNIASALLLAPEILPNIVVTWTAGYPSTVTGILQESFTMEQDMFSSQLLFDSGVPLVYLPGYHVGAQLRLSLPEVEAWVRGNGVIGDYLYELYTHNPHHAFHGLSDHFARTWVIWDLINFAWLMRPDWVPSHIIDAPHLTDDRKWLRLRQPRHIMREALDVNRDAVFRDFFGKLAQAYG